MKKTALALTLIMALLFSVAVILKPNCLASANYLPNPLDALSASYLASVSSSAGWNQTYGGADWDSAEAVVQTSDGGYTIAGSTRSFGAGWSDFWLVKTDSMGNMQWNKTYGGTDEDVAESAIQTSDGGYAIVGRTASSSWFVKTDSIGNMKWNRTYRGNYGDTSAYSVIQTSDGGYAVAGYTNFISGSSSDVWLIKIDTLGYMQWSKTYGEGGNDAARSVVQTRDGGYALVGSTKLGASEGDFLLVKTDPTGNMEWTQTYGSQDKDHGDSVVQTGDGGYALSGLMWNRSGSGSAGIIKTDSVGNIQWKRNYDGGTAWSTALTSDGGYIIACTTKLVKIDSEGNEQWIKTLDGNANSAIQTNDGGYAVAGVIANGNSSDFWLVKTDLEGNYNPFTPESTTTPSIPDPFPTALAATTLVSVAVASIGLLVYFKKRKR